jgi:hypothetical protein
MFIEYISSAEAMDLNKVTGKAIAVIGRRGSQVCETSRVPYFLDSQLTDSDKDVSRTWPPAELYPQEDSWYSFLLEGNIRSTEKPINFIKNATREPSGL